MDSYHYRSGRNYREEIIRSLGGYGKTIHEEVIDRGHKGGAEIHCITDNAIIVIYNLRTQKLITTLIARPEQLKSYNWKVPQKLLDMAHKRKIEGLNEF